MESSKILSFCIPNLYPFPPETSPTSLGLIYDAPIQSGGVCAGPISPHFKLITEIMDVMPHTA